MKKLFKALFYLVIVLMVLFIGAVGLVYLYFDPNDYKEQMAGAVKEQTGRELTIGGDIGLSFFPWIAVEMADVSLGNAPGFEEPVFAGVDKMRVSIKLLPLIKQEVEMDTVTLHGLRVNLARNAKGQTNWEDLTAGEPPAEEQAPTGPPPIAALAIGGLDVEDARIQWRDAQSGQHYELADLYLETGAIESGEPVDVDFGFRLDSKQPEMTADIKLTTRLTLDIGAEKYGASGLRLTVEATGDGLPVAQLEAALESDVAVDLAAQTADVRNLKLSALGLDASGELKATRIMEAPAYSGTFSLAEMDLRELLAKLDTPPVETADPDVLKAISMSTRIDGTADEVKLEDFNLKLDDSTLTGNLEVADFARPAVRFDLEMDAIDADRYLPPAAEAGDETASAGEGGGDGGGNAPPAQAAALAPLRTLDAAGDLRIGRLVINKLTLTDILVRLDGKDGVVKLDPISAELYEGLFKGQLTLDARQDVPRLAVKQTLKGIQAGPLLRDLTGEKERLTGTGQMNADITLSGMDPDTIKKTLEGTADFAFLEGAVKGVNIGRLIREARARLAGETLPPEEKEKQTDFSKLTGSVRIADGIVTNDDLAAKSPLLRITGKGQANLIAEEIDYVLTTTIVGTLKGQGGKELEELQGVPIPVRVSGTFQDPSYKPALGEVLKSKATQEVKKKAEEKVKEKLKDKLGGEKGQELLKGIFN